MVVTGNNSAFVDKDIRITELRGGGPNEICEPPCGVLVPLNLQIGWANHVGKDHRLDSFEISGERHAGGHLAAAESAVCVAPLNAVPVGPLTLSFFAVEKHNPGAESALGLASAENSGQLKHGASAGAAVVGADEVGQTHRVVVRGVEDDAAAGAGNLGDDVFHCKIAERRGAVEIMLLDRAAETFQLAGDIGLRAMDSVGTRRAGT